jgi:hypothetical protein
MAIIQVYGKNTIKNLLLDGGSGVNIITNNYEPSQIYLT